MFDGLAIDSLVIRYWRHLSHEIRLTNLHRNYMKPYESRSNALIYYCC